MAVRQYLHTETMVALRSAIPDRSRRYLVLLGIWLVVGTLSSLHWQLFYFGQSPYDWWELYRVKVALWYVWGALTPFMLALAWRFRFEKQRVARSLLYLVPISLVVTAAYMALYTGMVLFNMPDRELSQRSFSGMFGWIIGVHSSWYFLAFWATIGLENAVIYYRRAIERQRLMAELNTQLARVQLAALQQQLQPHFLFNTLHSILILVRQKRIADAVAMLSGLSDLLRNALDHLRQQEVPLEQELRLAQQYAAIESIRFSDRLTFDWQIGEATLAGLVPSFVLQPLVENAIRHGIEQRPGPGRVAVTAERDNGSLYLRVLDDGVGLKSGWLSNGPNGHGLGDLRTRLAALYPNNHCLELREPDSGGTMVELRIPYHEHALIP